MVTFGLVVAMGILPISAHSNIASAQEQEQTGTLVMTKEDEIDSFDDLAGMTLDMSNKNIVPDDSGKVEIDVNDAVQQGNMARNMIKGNLSFVIEGFNFKKMNGVSSINRPIQNIYVMNNEIYVTQTYTINDNREQQGNVKISRCVIDTKDNKTAKRVDDMNIEGVGHGQNLIPYQYNNKQYFIVCANAVNNNPTNEKSWEANKIGRIVYDAGTTKTSKNINMLEDTEYSNKTREPFNNIRRCAVYVSPDNKKILMFKQNTQRAVQYSFYDFDVVKQVLDSNSAKDMSFKYSDKLQAACYDYEINSNDLPVSQLQGIAIDNSLNIYIVCDGNGTYNTRADLCVIFKKSKRTIYYNVYWDISEEIEIEGIQVCNNKIYIGVSPKNEKSRNKAYIYSVDNGLIYE
jgi:hypothetical protein